MTPETTIITPAELHKILFIFDSSLALARLAPVPAQSNLNLERNSPKAA
jgi:hypothetical protein